MSRNTQERRDTAAGGHEAALTTAAPALILPSPGHAVWSPPVLATCLPSLPSTLHGRPHWLIYPPRTLQGSVGHTHCPRGFCPDWSEPRPSPPKSPSCREPALSSISCPDQTISLVSCPPSRGHPHPHTSPSPPSPSYCAPDPAAARTTRLCSTPTPASKLTLHRTPIPEHTPPSPSAQNTSRPEHTLQPGTWGLRCWPAPTASARRAEATPAPAASVPAFSPDKPPSSPW